MRQRWVWGVALGVLAGVSAAVQAGQGGAVAMSTAYEWQLSGGQGERIPLSNQEGLPGFRVIGQNNDMNFWQAEVPLEPGRLYRFDFLYVWRTDPVDGLVVAGPTAVRRTFPCRVAGMQEVGYVFMAPPAGADRSFRLGQWRTNDMVDMANPILTTVQAAHARQDGLELGEGEEINGHKYHFQAPMSGTGSNFSRPLGTFTASFNTDRWVIAEGQSVIYVHALAGVQQKSGRLEIGLREAGHKGRLLIEVSRDGMAWRELAIVDKPGKIDGDLPADLFPAEQVYVRLRAPDGASLQLDNYQYWAALDGPERRFRGQTLYVEDRTDDPSVGVRVVDPGLLRPSEQDSVTLEVTNQGTTGFTFVARAGSRATEPGEGFSIHRQDTLLAMGPDDKQPSFGRAAFGLDQAAPAKVEVAPGNIAKLQVPLTLAEASRLTARVEGWIERGGDRGQIVYSADWRFEVPFFYAADYGERLAAPEGVRLWWCDATRKVSRGRPVPTPAGEAIQLSAARNEFEAAQLVLWPEKDLEELTVTAGDLSRTGGQGSISAEHVQVLRVHYHPVQVPTDALGVADDWPDALPPLAGPITVPAGANQPLWVLVRVPADAAPGEYTGEIRLQATGWQAKVPLHLRVRGFTLPKEPFTHSAFGLGMGTVNRYHGLTAEADKREVFAKYMQSFADHRISPYNPAPHDGIQIKFIADGDPPRAEVDFERFDAAMERAIEEWNITSFTLHIPGMGGGTFHERREGEIAGFKAGTPQYEAMFGSAVSQIEQHLKAKGWLEKAYVYWFDEPDPKDYDFVREGMERLKQHAPGLRRMLTEEPVEPLFWAVDLWCPLSSHYDPRVAGRRRANGDQFWWYVCTGPKAPYCTLFIDHPATDLRVWLWQTWQRKIEGILIWESIYWTSDTAFPDSLQNPYADPMGYQVGYGLEKGQKRYWGNGDGRFLYPPEAAAAGAASPVLDGPVSSIRWEMLREGIEDVDYLHLLKAALAEKGSRLAPEVRKEAERLLDVPPEITGSLTEYTFDSRPIYERRRQIAEAIETLMALE